MNSSTHLSTASLGMECGVSRRLKHALASSGLCGQRRGWMRVHVWFDFMHDPHLWILNRKEIVTLSQTQENISWSSSGYYFVLCTRWCSVATPLLTTLKTRSLERKKFSMTPVYMLPVFFLPLVCRPDADNICDDNRHSYHRPLLWPNPLGWEPFLNIVDIYAFDCFWDKFMSSLTFRAWFCN